MPFHFTSPLTLNQLQTPASARARDAARSGAFPGPMVPSQPFSVESGHQRLNSEEAAMLQRVVNRLKRRREGIVEPTSASTIGQVFNV